MAGPTPVSALIHAATMVTAGVYMVVRSNILYSLAPDSLTVIAAIGTATALFAATIAIVQTDIKKVLAYSTVSQLGYMFAALGAGAYSSGLFHVTTHAFFKALLFLAAGSVIHAMGGEQDIRKMGGLKKKLPVTFLVFLAGTLAIAGVPPFAGFFSKDEILADVYLQNKFLFVLLSATSVITAYYMFRVLLLTFYGNFRGTHEQEHHLHESPGVMTIPLIILAVLSTVGGFMGLPPVFSEHHAFKSYLEPLLSFPAGFNQEEPSHFFEYAVMGIATGVLVIVWMLAHNRFVKRTSVMPLNEDEFGSSTRVLYNKYYVDEIYETLFVKPLKSISSLFYKVFDIAIIDGVVNGTGLATTKASGVLRRLQTGGIGFYIFVMVSGILLILLLNLFVL
jgi:NADH-quinone oxidoreductase subunit L